MSNAARPVYRAVTGIGPPYVMYNTSTGSFYGYCIDLLNDIGFLAGFDYTIRKSLDDQYGFKDPGNGSWNGMIAELIKNTSDIAVGPIWITSDRSKVVDFTVPYQGTSGFTIMMLKKRKQVPFLRFLTILELEIWLCLALAFLSTILLLFILERYSPFSYRNNRARYRDQPDDRFCTARGCFWFVFTSLTPHGGGDIPKNFSGKMAATSWWLFGFVIASAYAANLAAYETLGRLEKDIGSLEDLAKQYRVSYSTVADSTAHRYFRAMKKTEETLYGVWRRITQDGNTEEWNRSEYAVWDYPLEDKFTKMYYAMEQAGFVRSVEEAVKTVRKVNRTFEFAFIADAMTINYLILTNCDFRQVGQQFSRKPFAFAVQKDSPFKRRIDDAITRLAILGRLKELERKWWDENPSRANCPSEADSNAGFGQDNLAAVFSLIPLGLFLAILILCSEYFRRSRPPDVPERKKTLVFARAGPAPAADETSEIKEHRNGTITEARDQISSRVHIRRNDQRGH
ncbi:ionotropic receptor 25a-like [Halictus rubicundus]|uniref:ionotropic receptor 25a-like n=1 Tax=Halictus rubicundus TaxID=77578 RepID=UPI004036AB9C